MLAHDSLVLFKRHFAECDVHKSKVPLNKRRFWFDCECPFWIVGRTPDGNQERHAAQLWLACVAVKG